MKTVFGALVAKKGEKRFFPKKNVYFLYFSVNFQDIGFKFSGYVDMDIMHFLPIVSSFKFSRKIFVLALLYSMDSCRCPQYVFVHENGFWSPGGEKKAKNVFFL